MLEKVTIFITRQKGRSIEVLLFKHPTAGIQFPAGTVEHGESPMAAAAREAYEETGISDLPTPMFITSQDQQLSPKNAVVLTKTTVFSHPDHTSFDWAYLPRGAWVEILRHKNGYTQVVFIEPDKLPESEFGSYQITGWVPDNALTYLLRRNFFYIDYPGETPAIWQVQTDNHFFKCFWASLLELPPFIHPQSTWPPILLNYLDK